MSLAALRKDLKRVSDPTRAAFVASFFKTKTKNDRFAGIRVPDCHTVAKKYNGLPLKNIKTLLASRIHEERLVALFILIHQFEAEDKQTQSRLYRFYLANAKHVNNWELVDASAHKIVGAYLLDKDRTILDRLARSTHLWTRRIALDAPRGRKAKPPRPPRLSQNPRSPHAPHHATICHRAHDPNRTEALDAFYIIRSRCGLFVSGLRCATSRHKETHKSLTLEYEDAYRSRTQTTPHA